MHRDPISDSKEPFNICLRSLAFDAAPQGLAVIDAKGRICDANEALCRLVGRTRSDVIGTIHATLIQDPPADTPVPWMKPDGGQVWLRIHSAPLSVPDASEVRELLIFEDITLYIRQEHERQILENRLRRSQRMEAVGRLAGGIAHDFNNMLSIIINYAEFARRVAPDGRSRDYLDAIRKGALRAAALTRQLLIFGRRDTAPPTAVDLNRVLRELDRLLRRTLGEDIEVEIHLDESLGAIHMALPYAEQVVMNLAVNARDAMPNGGRLLLGTHAIELNPIDVQGRIGARPGRHVCLTVQDTGVGMTEEVLSLAFDPFFTTKQPGEGTGLGLSIVYGIVHEAGGFIDVDTAPGVGSTFRILLPITDFQAPELLESEATPPQGKGETVLVVEDEPTVRALTVQILRESGYRVTEAQSAANALELCRNADQAYDVLLTDLIMPGMSGTELAVCVTALWQETRVLFMSGYAADRLDAYRADHEQVVLVQKPFNGDDLLYALRRILDAETEASSRTI
jgi:two-component system cell cycle sensor histidine kinase/response regulator CckA